jgi:hypothetical protein
LAVEEDPVLERQEDGGIRVKNLVLVDTIKLVLRVDKCLCRGAFLNSVFTRVQLVTVMKYVYTS